MPTIRKIETYYPRSTDFTPSEQYLVTLTQDDLATVCKAALLWNVDKEKSLELTIAGGILILREVLPSAGHPRPPELR